MRFLNLLSILLAASKLYLLSFFGSSSSILSSSNEDEIVRAFQTALSQGDFSDPRSAPINFVCLQRITRQQISSPSSPFDWNKLEGYFNTCTDKPTFVIFSEYFWRNYPDPLTIEESNTIKNEVAAVSEKYPYCVFFVPFLEVFETPTQQIAPMLEQKQKKDLFRSAFEETVEDISKTDKPHVCNRLHVYWNGLNIAYYDKSTYAGELPKIHKYQIFYQFGDFQTHESEGVEGSAKDMAQFFTGNNPIVSIRICADINPKFLLDEEDRFHSRIPDNSKKIVVVGSGAPMLFFNQGLHRNNITNQRALILSDTMRGRFYYPYIGNCFYYADNNLQSRSLGCINYYAFNFAQNPELLTESPPNEFSNLRLSSKLFSQQEDNGIIPRSGDSEFNHRHYQFVEEECCCDDCNIS